MDKVVIDLEDLFLRHYGLAVWGMENGISAQMTLDLACFMAGLVIRDEALFQRFKDSLAPVDDSEKSRLSVELLESLESFDAVLHRKKSN